MAWPVPRTLSTLKRYRMKEMPFIASVPSDTLIAASPTHPTAAMVPLPVFTIRASVP